jgi:hypothetical protein
MATGWRLFANVGQAGEKLSLPKATDVPSIIEAGRISFRNCISHGH